MKFTYNFYHLVSKMFHCSSFLQSFFIFCKRRCLTLLIFIAHLTLWFMYLIKKLTSRIVAFFINCFQIMLPVLIKINLWWFNLEVSQTSITKFNFLIGKGSYDIKHCVTNSRNLLNGVLLETYLICHHRIKFPKI